MCYLTAFHRLSDVSKPYYPLYAAEYARLFPRLSGDFSRSFRCLSIVSLRSLILLLNHFHGLSGLLRGYRALFAFFSDISDDIFPILSAFLEESQQSFAGYLVCFSTSLSVFLSEYAPLIRWLCMASLQKLTRFSAALGRAFPCLWPVFARNLHGLLTRS